MGEPIRVGRVREKIKADVAQILQQELSDPRMGFVTVIGCDLAQDYRTCKVRVSVLADKDSEVRRVMRMLQDATGFVQREVARRLRTRVTPVLTFELDRGVEESVRISSLLDGLKAEREAREAGAAAGAEGVAISADLGSEDAVEGDDEEDVEGDDEEDVEGDDDDDLGDDEDDLDDLDDDDEEDE